MGPIVQNVGEIREMILMIGGEATLSDVSVGANSLTS